MGSIPAGCWAFFYFYPQYCDLKQVLRGGAAILFFLLKKIMPSLGGNFFFIAIAGWRMSRVLLVAAPVVLGVLAWKFFHHYQEMV